MGQPENYRELLKMFETDPVWDPTPAYTPQYGNKPVRKARYATETEKPIGTRDPDKFLKEQQDRLWEEMMK